MVQTAAIPDSLTKLAYQTFQQGKSYFGLTHKILSTRLRELVAPDANPKTQELSPEILLQVQEKLNHLLEEDWADAEAGVYPTSLLFDNPWEDFFRYYPAVWFDSPQVWERIAQKRYQDFSETAANRETFNYPSYYLQNFHHQTDGYLSDMSANLYDLQVEILFNGSADPMRRRILAPLKQGLQTLQDDNHAPIRVLDVACGTGRTLKLLRQALPEVSLLGVDLSPTYLRKANQLLSQDAGDLPQLIQANAEDLPYQDQYFQGLTCVFLFHELPADARQNVINESFRVLKPRGTYVICDSIQLEDAPELKPMMENFPTMFHEPYYRHYITDNLVEHLEAAGFVDVQTEVHFMSKYWVAHKPA